MGIKVKWTRPALRQLSMIAGYIESDSKYHAAQFILNVRTLAWGLERYPDRGRIVPEFQREDLRELIWTSYRLIYQTSEKNVFIVMIIHGARNLNDFSVPDLG